MFLICSFERRVNIFGIMDHLDISKLDSIIEILIKKVMRNVCLRGDSQSVTQLISLFPPLTIIFPHSYTQEMK